MAENGKIFDCAPPNRSVWLRGCRGGKNGVSWERRLPKIFRTAKFLQKLFHFIKRKMNVNLHKIFKNHAENGRKWQNIRLCPP